MAKIGTIPEFTDGDNTHEEEVKEEETLEEEQLEGEETPTESSEEKKQTEVVETITKDKATSESEKLSALEELRKTEEELNKDTSELDMEIEARKERIVEKRKERREKRDLVDKIDISIPSQEDKLEDIDPTTLQILERFTKAKGLVPRAELKKMDYESQHKGAEETFYGNHKEYAPENDKDDFLYKALQRELSLYAKPSNSSLIPKLFEKAHSEVKKQYPQFFKETKILEKINANERTRMASMGGGNSGGASRPQAKSKDVTLSALQIQALRQGGWSEDEIEELNSK